MDEFDFEQWQSRSGSFCNKCGGEDGVKRRKVTEVQNSRNHRNMGRHVSPTPEGILDRQVLLREKVWEGAYMKVA